MSRPYGEASVDEQNFAISITSTNTIEKWRQWAKEDILVKTKTDSVKSRANGLLEIEPCTADTDVPIGTLRSIVGDPNTLPNKVTARVAVQAWRINVPGAATGELADDDISKRIKPNADGKASIVSTGGYGRVQGGTKSQLVMQFDWRDNIR